MLTSPSHEFEMSSIWKHVKPREYHLIKDDGETIASIVVSDDWKIGWVIYYDGGPLTSFTAQRPEEAAETLMKSLSYYGYIYQEDADRLAEDFLHLIYHGTS